MQQIVIYWQSVVPQHFYRASLRPSSGGQTAFHCLWFLSRCSCCDAGDSGSKMCALWGGCCLLSQDVCTVRRMLLVESSKMCALWGGCCLLSQARCVHCEEDVACWVKQDVCTVRRMLLVESNNILHTVHTSFHQTVQHHNSYNRTDNCRQWNAVGSPDDGHRGARDMLRYYWLPINHYLFAFSWPHLYLLIYLGCVIVLNQMQHLLKCYQHVQNGTLQHNFTVNQVAFTL